MCDSLCINSIAIRAISCCLVIAVRADLREEFDMADDVFALSPISARATLPSEEDYAAIAEAFMETSRGRWFLTEYAKRNRNADTRMVLDAVARIEQNLAAQREEELEREANLQREEGLSAQQAQEAVAAAAAAQERLTEALSAIRSLVEAAEESAFEALDSLALEKRLAPVRKGARVLREIAWRLREIGNDGRICDLIDSQVTVIEKSTDQFSSDDARLALRAAFAALQGRLVEFGDEDPTLEVEAEAEMPSPAAPALDRVAEIAEAVFAREAAKARPVSEPLPVAEAQPTAPIMRAEPAPKETPPSAPVAFVKEATAAETAFQNADPQDADEDTADAIEADVEDANVEDTDAQDEALLDMVAMEMGAPDPIGEDEIEIAAAIAAQAYAVEPAPVAPATTAKAPEPVVTPPAQPIIQAPPPAPAPAVEMSLGSSLIASGLLKKPMTAANDPLAPIRRMSQAEKIAFFS
jgi:hypothetical protein